MQYGDLQFFDIIIFAAIAVFIIYRLRSVLGKRTGFEKNITNKPKQNPKEEVVTYFISYTIHMVYNNYEYFFCDSYICLHTNTKSSNNRSFY